jgi:hypothetical protein
VIYAVTSSHGVGVCLKLCIGGRRLLLLKVSFTVSLGGEMEKGMKMLVDVSDLQEKQRVDQSLNTQ